MKIATYLKLFMSAILHIGIRSPNKLLDLLSLPFLSSVNATFNTAIWLQD